VLLERLLRKPVEGERGDGAFEMRSAKASGAMRAAPAREVVAVDPDQAFTHTSAFVCEFRARPRRLEDNNDGSSAEGELLHAAVYFARF